MNSKPRWRPVVASLAVLLTATLGMSSAVAANSPAKNGPITFMREDDDGFWQTWTARADMSQALQLTHLQANSGWSVWSPDSSRIAFDSDRADPDVGDDVAVNDIFTMKPNGQGIVKLTDSSGFSGDAAYSPNGKLIAFESDFGDFPAKQGIYLMDASDGSHVRRVTTLPAGGTWDGAPRFSPDGKWLVFTREREAYTRPSGDVVEWTSVLYVVRLDGSGLKRISPWKLRAGDAAWSPDGTKLVFELIGPTIGSTDDRGDAWIVRSDGSGLKNLTIHAAVPDSIHEAFYDPTWAPDGSLILLGYERFSTAHVFTAGLATIRPNGSDLQYLQGEGSFEHQPDWGRAPRH